MADTVSNYKTEKEIYQSVASIPVTLQDALVSPFVPKITPIDIDNGYVMRYFSRPSTQHTGEIIEISFETYSNIKNNSRYIVVSIPWHIKGELTDRIQTMPDGTNVRMSTGIVTANKAFVTDANQLLPGIIFQLSNYTQFYQGV
jgi:hypothetical protein